MLKLEAMISVGDVLRENRMGPIVQSPEEHPYCRKWNWIWPDRHGHAEYDLIGRIQ